MNVCAGRGNHSPRPRFQREPLFFQIFHLLLLLCLKNYESRSGGDKRGWSSDWMDPLTCIHTRETPSGRTQTDKRISITNTSYGVCVCVLIRGIKK